MKQFTAKAIEDLELIEIVKSRAGDEVIEVDINDL